MFIKLRHRAITQEEDDTLCETEVCVCVCICFVVALCYYCELLRWLQLCC